MQPPHSLVAPNSLGANVSPEQKRVSEDQYKPENIYTASQGKFRIKDTNEEPLKLKEGWHTAISFFFAKHVLDSPGNTSHLIQI